MIHQCHGRQRLLIAGYILSIAASLGIDYHRVTFILCQLSSGPEKRFSNPYWLDFSAEGKGLRWCSNHVSTDLFFVVIRMLLLINLSTRRSTSSCNSLNLQPQPSESAGHVFNVCQHRLIFATCSCQRSTLAYMEQFPAELCSFDVIGC